MVVVAIGNHYDDGVWWRLQDMLRYTEQQGYLGGLEEGDDMCMMATDAIGIMGGWGGMLGVGGGVEGGWGGDGGGGCGVRVVSHGGHGRPG